MPAIEGGAATSGPLWVHEIKHDGYRLMVRRDSARARCFTRNGHDWADRFPAIVDAAHRIKASSFLIDGEVVIVRDDGTVARRLEIDQGLYDDRAGTSVVQRELLPMARSGSIRRRSVARRAPPASFSAPKWRKLLW